MPSEIDEQRDRVLDAALRLVARWGVGKTSMADVAKETGCSRATVYRLFPGGKQQVFTTLAHREITGAAAEVIEAFRLGDDLTDALTRAIVVAARLLEDHEAARRILDDEPEVVLPYLGFGRIDTVYRLAVDTFAPVAAERVEASRAPWLVEWCVRLFISFVTAPDPHFDLTDIDGTRSLVHRFIEPAFAGDHLTEPVPI